MIQEIFLGIILTVCVIAVLYTVKDLLERDE